VNADYLVRRGAAVRLDDAALAADLAPTVRRLLDDPPGLAAMRAAARSAAQPQAAHKLAGELAALAARRRPGARA
jgi:UDP-N-acetylglucosamine:LPS N-acetylglucosamine transferase